MKAGPFTASVQQQSSVEVFSGFYLARIPDLDWITFMLQGTDQDSDVNTLGGIGVVGKGKIIGGRAIFTLPQLTNYYHSLSLGVDYKHFDQDVTIAGVPSVAPVTYIPFTAAYSGSWINRTSENKVLSETDLNASVNLSIREWDSADYVFEQSRFASDGSYIYFRGDVSHTHELPLGFQVFAKVQGQASEKPLVSSEQFSAGGLGTVRGYLESEEVGDNGIAESLELRTPLPRRIPRQGRRRLALLRLRRRRPPHHRRRAPCPAGKVQARQRRRRHPPQAPGPLQRLLRPRHSPR